MAATKVGTLAIADLRANKQTTVAEVDEQELAAILQRELQAHNELTDDFVNGLADVTTERQQQAGVGETGEMMEADEYARVPTQKADVGANLGFPMKKYDFAVGWTQLWFEMASLADFASRATFAQNADTTRILREAKKALYLSSNYSLTDKYQAPALSLDVKRLANADSFAIPTGPNGEAFDASTHSHYTAEASLTAAGLLAAVNNVLEHFNNAQVEIDINQADQAGVEALTGFKEFVEEGVTLSEGDPTQRMSSTNINNRAIGRFGGAIVWVKPWAIDNYALIRVTGGAPKPLAYRQPVEERRRGLRVLADLNTHPLHAQYLSRLFGFGVASRVSAAVHQFSNGTYQDPTI